MTSPYVRPPHEWDEYQRSRRDRTERRGARVDGMRRRAGEGLSYEHALHGYRRRRAVALMVLLVVVGVIVIVSVAAHETSAIVVGAVLLLVVLLANALLWRLVVGTLPVLHLTPLPDSSPRHPVFENLDGPTRRPADE